MACSKLTLVKIAVAVLYFCLIFEADGVRGRPVSDWKEDGFLVWCCVVAIGNLFLLVCGFCGRFGTIQDEKASHNTSVLHCGMGVGLFLGFLWFVMAVYEGWSQDNRKMERVFGCVCGLVGCLGQFALAVFHDCDHSRTHEPVDA